MQTILGASGQIGTGVAEALHAHHTTDIRLVSRNPRRLHPTDELLAADLTDAAETRRAVAGSEVAYLTVGLPPDARLWAEQLPVMMKNVIGACAAEGTRLVFFDNTYMYPQTADPQTEETAFAPRGPKSRVRAEIATLLLQAMAAGQVEALIGRAPEFYGPGRTQSFTTSLMIDRIRAGERPRVPVRTDTRRTLIWTPDASRALALLGNTPDAFGRTWHLPCDDEHPTYAEFLSLAGSAVGQDLDPQVLPAWQFRLAGLVSRPAREIVELLPRYGVDAIFLSSTFTAAFPDFSVTRYAEGLAALAAAPTGPTRATEPTEENRP